jgi:hypothetical protein
MILTNKLLVSGGSLVPRPNDAALTFTFNALDLPEIRQKFVYADQNDDINPVDGRKYRTCYSAS